MTKKTQTPSFVERRWKGIPIRDAVADLLVLVSQTDIKHAIPGDSAHCAASLACIRLYQSTGVEFFRSIAYVDLPDPTSENPSQRVVFRFQLDSKTRRLIQELDGGGEPFPGGYRLRAPVPSETLDTQLVRSRAHEKRVQDARIRGEIYEPQHKRYNPEQAKGFTPLMPGMNGYIRSGTGQVQMTRSES